MITVYVDVLIGLNLFINYFLFWAVAAFTHFPLKNRRNLLASFLLSFSSLLIFLPELSPWIGLPLRLCLAAVGVALAFGFPGISGFLRLTGAFYVATFAFGGIMLGLWYLFKPTGLTVHNGIVYYNLSPLLLVIFTLVAYGLLWLFRKNFRKDYSLPSYITLHLQHADQTLTVQVMIDTGFGLTDLYGDRPVALLSAAAAKKLFSKKELTYRLIPYKTVNGSGILQSALCRHVTAEYKGKTVFLGETVIAMGKDELQNGFHGLVGRDFLERMEWNAGKNQEKTAATLAADRQKTNRLYRRFCHPAPSLEQGAGEKTDGASEAGR